MQIPNTAQGEGPQTPLPGPAFLSTQEGQVALAVMALGCVLILAITIALRTKETSPNDVLRGYLLTLIIIGTLLLITVGYTQAQIAPAVGLFGTIAGYLLGHKEQK